MNDVTLFWLAFACYLLAAFVLSAAAFLRAGDGLARFGRGLVWLGLAAHTGSIVWRAFIIGTEPLHMFFPRLGAAFSAGPAWQAATYVLLFVVPAAAVAVGVIFRKSSVIWLPAAAVAVVLEMILLDFLDFTRLPIEKVFEYLSFASWCSAIALLTASPKVRLVVIDAALAIAASLLTVFAAIQPKSVELQLVPALQSYWLFIHVSLTGVGFAVFAAAFVVGALLLVKAYDASLAPPGARRHFVLLAAAAKGAALVLALGLVFGRVILPFREVAYAPHQVPGAAEAPPSALIQVVRYGAALLGVFATLAFVFVWAIYPLARRRDDRSGFGSFLFVVCSLALFVACLLLGGITRAQEHAIAGLREEQEQLVRLANDDKLGLQTGKLLRPERLDEDIERWRALSRQARAILGKARWLPLSLERRTELAEDPVFQSLNDLFDKTGTKWQPVVRYRDIKQVGREMGERADNTQKLSRRLSFPADYAQLERVEKAIQDEYRSREANALLPRKAAGQLAAFVGLATLIAIPIGLALYFGLPRLRERLPDVARLDRISYGSVLIGYPVFTFGALLAGAIWAHFAWGNWWSWDPKEVGSLVGWVLYTIYLHQRYREGLTPRGAALAAILGFLACVLSLAGNAFLGGLHAYS